MVSEIYLLRHGETEWTISGRHTGITEVLLTKNGEKEAMEAGQRLQKITFDRVLTSPRKRAQRTCDLAGLGSNIEINNDLSEWNYGDYEGLLQSEIQKLQPGWNVFEYGCPRGESPEQVSNRVDRLLSKLRQTKGKIALVSHGHFTRALAIRWVGLPIQYGNILSSSTASISILGFNENNGQPLIKLWNQTLKL
ncbi:MAG: histidine phosphatase family protein [Elusimicrobiota bacterium]